MKLQDCHGYACPASHYMTHAEWNWVRVPQVILCSRLKGRPCLQGPRPDGLTHKGPCRKTLRLCSGVISWCVLPGMFDVQSMAVQQTRSLLFRPTNTRMTGKLFLTRASILLCAMQDLILLKSQCVTHPNRTIRQYELILNVILPF